MISAEAHRGFIREITVFTEGTDAQMRAAMVRVATAQRDRVLSEQTARAGVAPLYRQFVDGSEGAPLDAVKADGVIVFIWNYLVEVVSEAMLETAAAVPVVTGNLLAHLTLFVDGVEAPRDDNGEALLGVITTSTKQAIIVADVDYARRLEVGLRRDGTPFVVQVKPHFIQAAATVLQAKFRDQATILFNFTELGAAGTTSPIGRRGRRRQAGGKAPMLYPSIIITPKTG
jgi:hypothetical protein